MMILKKLDSMDNRMQRIEKMIGKVFKMREMKDDGRVKEESDTVEDEYMVRYYSTLLVLL